MNSSISDLVFYLRDKNNDSFSDTSSLDGSVLDDGGFVCLPQKECVHAGRFYKILKQKNEDLFMELWMSYTDVVSSLVARNKKLSTPKRGLEFLGMIRKDAREIYDQVAAIYVIEREIARYARILASTPEYEYHTYE